MLVRPGLGITGLPLWRSYIRGFDARQWCVRMKVSIWNLSVYGRGILWQEINKTGCWTCEIQIIALFIVCLFHSNYNLGLQNILLHRMIVSDIQRYHYLLFFTSYKATFNQQKKLHCNHKLHKAQEYIHRIHVTYLNIYILYLPFEILHRRPLPQSRVNNTLCLQLNAKWILKHHLTYATTSIPHKDGTGGIVTYAQSIMLTETI